MLLPGLLARRHRRRSPAGAERPVGGRGVSPVSPSSASARPARSAKTSPSSREFDASRLAPCTPVRGHLANGPEPRHAWSAPRDRCERRPSRSAAPARPGGGRAQHRARGSEHGGDAGEPGGEVLDRRGRRARRRPWHPPRRRRGRRRPAEPARPGGRHRARIGARPGPPGCAPAPRTASEMSGAGLTPGSLSAVGWNWRNSRSRSWAPARCASAHPSAVATFGLVVTAYSWPTPPVASTTARGRNDPAPLPRTAPPHRRLDLRRGGAR